MANLVQTPATVDDLYREEGKAELINGRIVRYMATGRKPNRVAGRIYRSLDDHATATKVGEVYTDNMGFIVDMLPSGRQSFSPDTSYYDGPLPANDMRFVDGPPTLAVEVRSENDYSPSADQRIAEKRADYFAAGTAVVWDVDPINDRIDVYRATDSTVPVTYQRGDTAEAEPAVPGWRVAVNWIFEV